MQVTDRTALLRLSSLLTLTLDTVLASGAIWFLSPQQIVSSKLGAYCGRQATQHSSKSDSWLEGKRGQLWKEQTQLKKQAIGNQAAKGGLDFLCPVVPEVGLFILHRGNCFIKEKTFPVHASIQGEKYKVSPLVDS